MSLGMLLENIPIGHDEHAFSWAGPLGTPIGSVSIEPDLMLGNVVPPLTVSVQVSAEPEAKCFRGA